jgi:hypothetical protein
MEREVNARFIILLEANEVISPTGGILLTDDGPMPLDEETARRLGRLICGFCGHRPESHGDSDAGPMSVCPEHNDGSPDA